MNGQPIAYEGDIAFGYPLVVLVQDLDPVDALEGSGGEALVMLGEVPIWHHVERDRWISNGRDKAELADRAVAGLAERLKEVLSETP